MGVGEMTAAEPRASCTDLAVAIRDHARWRMKTDDRWEMSNGITVSVEPDTQGVVCGYVQIPYLGFAPWFLDEMEEALKKAIPLIDIDRYRSEFVGVWCL